MLPSRSCRKSIASSPGWRRPQAHTVSFFLGRHSPYIKPDSIYPSITDRIIVSIPAFTDSSQKDLLKLIGNLPVKYGGKCDLLTPAETVSHVWGRDHVLMTVSLSEGRSYNIPILLWLMDSFPFTPPICLLRPTANMVIREGKHVDAQGRLHLPGLRSWDYVRV